MYGKFLFLLSNLLNLMLEIDPKQSNQNFNNQLF